MYVTFDLSVLKRGDIILSTSSHWISRLIRWSTASRYSHAMLYTDTTIVQAVGAGVWTINPQRQKYKQDDVCVFRVPGMTTVTVNAICADARAKSGARYATAEAILALWLRVSRKGALGQNQYCSRLVAMAFSAHGIFLHSNPSHCLPSDIADTLAQDKVPNAMRVWTASDQWLVDHTTDTLAIESRHVFSFLRPLDWVSVLTGNGRICDVDAAWQVASQNRFIDLVAAHFLRRSGWGEASALDTQVNRFRYDMNLYGAKLNAMGGGQALFLQKEWSHASAASGAIVNNLTAYAAKGKAKTIRLVKDFEYDRLDVMVIRLDLLAQVTAPGFLSQAGSLFHGAISAHLAAMQWIATTRPY